MSDAMTDAMTDAALILSRLRRTDFATYGEIIDPMGNVVCVTLERPWVKNQSDVSCVPAGQYVAERYASPKRGYDVFMLQNVPGRSAIELHVGNVPADTDGCILLGTSRGIVNGQEGIVGSKLAFDAFMQRFAGIDHFLLRVVDPISTDMRTVAS